MSSRGDGRAAVAAMSLVYLGFAMPIAMLGVAWPSIRDELDRPNSALGVLALAYGLGRLSTSASGGLLLARARFGRATAGVAGSLAIATAAVALAPSWPVLVATTLAVGLASGGLDSLGGRFIASLASVGVAGFLAGSYGVGATIGPALAAIGDRWRLAYGFAAVVCVVGAVVVARPSIRWPERIVAGPRAGGDSVPSWRSPAVLVSLLAMYVFVGIEVTAGQWTATYLEDVRAIDGQVAGLAVSGFWGGLTVGRLALGVLRVGPGHLLGLTAVLAGGLASLTVLPGAAVVAGAAVVGLALSPMFPTLMATTADRVGEGAAGRVSGWQLVAGNVGATTLPAAVGVGVAISDERAPIVVLLAVTIAGAVLLVRIGRLAAPTGG